MQNETQPGVVRNPFGAIDVPDPDGADVAAFAASVKLEGMADDSNATRWASIDVAPSNSIEGAWCSRWNGGADPTLAGDAADKWKQGRAELRAIGDRFFLYFDWHDGARRGLIEAMRLGENRMAGKYINLTNPDIVRPWIGLIVGPQRIDGCWTSGRLNFRR
jgi:hypothetical protein